MTFRKGFRQPPQGQNDSTRLVKLFESNDWNGLEKAAREFIRKNPRHALGPKALIASLTQQDRIAEALSTAEIALVQFPDDSELHNNHAAAQIKASLFEDAIASADKALRLNPGNAGAYSNRGIACRNLGMWPEALASYYKAIELNPHDAKSLNNAGVALVEMEHLDQAITCLKAALELAPDYDEAQWNLGRANEELKLFKDAKTEFLKVLAQDPNNAFARARLAHIFRTECLFEESENQTDRLLTQIRSGSPLGNISPFPVLSLEGSTTNDQRIAGRSCAEATMDAFLHPPPMVTQSRSTRGNRLRIGYLSSDFHHHATLMLMIGVLEHHNLDEVDIYIYSHGVDDGSDLRKRAEKACTVFRNIRQLSYLDSARRIAEDQIDILVDLKGYTKDGRLQICALRPAPIIVSWLGYPGTLGHRRLADYIIGDPIVTPLEHQEDYSETLALMPHCYQPNDGSKIVGAMPSRSTLGLPEEALVFCSFNQTYKITAPVLLQWCRLLKAIPDSVLWLLVEKEDIRGNLLEFAAKQGITASRIVFASSMSIEDHLARLQQADIALDTSPYSSHTTGSDALWAGVPMIAIRGNTFASRVSSSLLQNVGLQELIVDNAEAACDLAINLASNRQRLQDLKQRLTSIKKDSHLFNTAEFTRNLERLYAAIWAQQASDHRRPIVLTQD